MRVFLPKPYQDELLYSVIARYLVEVKPKKRRVAIATVFGKCIIGYAEMSALIGEVAKRTWDTWGLTARQIIDAHTLFPYYSRFASESTINLCLNSLINDSSNNVLTKFGTATSNLRSMLYFRFCPECRLEDIEIHGVTYWRRLHQITGVDICPVHKCELIDSTARMKMARIPFYYDATEHTANIHADLTIKIRDDHINMAVLIAKRCQEILQKNDQYRTEGNVFQSNPQEVIKKGYTKYFDKIDYELLQKKFEDFWGLDFLGSMSISYKSGYCTWFHNIIDGSTEIRRPKFQTLLHVLVQIFLENLPTNTARPSNIGIGPWKCLNSYCNNPEEYPIKRLNYFKTKNGVKYFMAECSCGYKFILNKVSEGDPGLPVMEYLLDYGHVLENIVTELLDRGMGASKIVKETGLTIAAVRRILNREQNRYNVSEEQRESWRKECLTILENTPNRNISAAERNNPVLFQILRTRDYEWLRSLPRRENITRKRKNRTSGKKYTITDEELSNKIKSIAPILFGKIPIIYVSKSRAILEAGARPPTVLAHPDRFPLTLEILNEVCETSAVFMERKRKQKKLCR